MPIKNDPEYLVAVAKVKKLVAEGKTAKYILDHGDTGLRGNQIIGLVHREQRRLRGANAPADVVVDPDAPKTIGRRQSLFGPPLTVSTAERAARGFVDADFYLHNSPAFEGIDPDIAKALASLYGK